MHSLTSIGNWKSVSVMVASVTAMTVLLLLVVVASNSPSVQAQTPDGDAQKYENMDPLLYEIVQQYERGEFAASAAAASAPVSNGASVGVIFLTESGKANDISEFLVDNGVTPGPAFDDFVGADVPVSLLASVVATGWRRMDGGDHPPARGPERFAAGYFAGTRRGCLASGRDQGRGREDWRDLAWLRRL